MSYFCCRRRFSCYLHDKSANGDTARKTSLVSSAVELIIKWKWISRPQRKVGRKVLCVCLLASRMKDLERLAEGLEWQSFFPPPIAMTETVLHCMLSSSGEFCVVYIWACCRAAATIITVLNTIAYLSGCLLRVLRKHCRTNNVWHCEREFYVRGSLDLSIRFVL